MSTESNDFVHENKFKKLASRNAVIVDPEDNFDLNRQRQLLKPDDQLDLTEAELREEITKVLTTINPCNPKNEVVYSFACGQYVPVNNEHIKSYELYTLQGTAICKDSAEARAQIAAGYGAVNLDDSGPKKTKAKKTTEQEEEEDEGADDAEEDEDDEEEAVEEKKEEVIHNETEDLSADIDKSTAEEVTDNSEPITEKEDYEEPVVIQAKITKLANQFNFCERAALTATYSTRSVETQTVPPPRATFSATAAQSIIYDFYQEDQVLQQEKECDKTKKVSKKAIPQLKEKTEKELQEEKVQQKCREAWNILERLVNQNIYDDIAHDYRYWEDPSDEFRDGDGSLLPLWKFCMEKMRGSAVTALMWNPHYNDLFAVSYGSLDFMNVQNEGCLCLFTTKNPSYPEYFVTTDSPVLTLDIHMKYSYLIVVGQYDGNVCIYNTQLTTDKSYQYKSDSVSSKHESLIWEVKWGPDLADGECSFFSVSEDGKVISWSVLPGELLAATAIHLILSRDPAPGPVSSLLPIKGCGTCITFHPDKEEVYLVGTEEGLIHKCSKAYSRNYLSTLKAHKMPVYQIHFNKYDSSIFVSCGGDWRVNIWEDGRDEPLFMFDLGSSVGDVKWAPYSSTVFAACTFDGKVFVFDLNINKYKPICMQSVVSKKMKKLTRIDFNNNLPIIICGDSKGTVHMLKLSPNLRIMCKATKKQQHLDQRTLQEMKLAKLLSLVRDPPTTVEVIDEKIEED